MSDEHATKRSKPQDAGETRSFAGTEDSGCGHRNGEVPTISVPMIELPESSMPLELDPWSDEDVRPRRRQREDTAVTILTPLKQTFWRSDSFVLTSKSSPIETDNKTVKLPQRHTTHLSVSEVKSKATRCLGEHRLGADETDDDNWRPSKDVRARGTLRRSSASQFTVGLEWITRKNFEMYNVASTQLRRILQTPTMSLDLNDVPQGAFAGPLLEIFPDSSFVRSSREDRAKWDEVMGIGKWRYPAEDSGLVTFWQAILVNMHWLRGGLSALLSLTGGTRSDSPSSARAQSRLFDCITYPMGQLLNAIGLSWEHHHARNLKKMDEADRQRINIESLSHRHHKIQSKLWEVLLKLEGVSKLKSQAQRAQTMNDAHKKFEEFYVYLIYTVKIILEDALFLYRSSLSEQQMSCLGDADCIGSNSLDSNLVWQAMIVIVGGTPISHWKKRFDYMGHGWVIRQTALKLGLRRYHRVFLNPIKQTLQAAEVIKAASPDE